jgi:hypothetical protein
MAVVLLGDDGCRLRTRLPDSCHTLRRVSGARFVWVGRIRALCNDVPPCVPFHLWSKSRACLGRVVGFPVLRTYLEGIRLSHRSSFV